MAIYYVILNLLQILPLFRVALVKFDRVFPYGDKHDEYIKVAEAAHLNKDLLLAEVNAAGWCFKSPQRTFCVARFVTSCKPSVNTTSGFGPRLSAFINFAERHNVK